MSTPSLLEDVRVIDLSQYIPGPFATRQLADLGAEVIKIEPPGGDPMRFFMQRDSAQVSAVYRHVNRGKKICELDLKSDDGKAHFSRLLADADILLESWRPGVIARLGFDRAAIESVNPRLVHCALSGYGQSGPYATRAGHDLNYCALASQSLLSGSAARPYIAFPPIADHASALQASTTLLAALHARDRHPGGQYIDLSIAESILAWQYLPLLSGAAQREASILDGGAACYNIYECADGAFVSLGAIEAVFWKSFCHALQRSDWVERQYESMPQQELIAEVAAEIAGRDSAHWRALLDPLDCCFELLFAPDEIAEHPQFEHRRALGDDGPNYPAWFDGEPLAMSGGPLEVDSADLLEWRPRR